MYPDIWRFVPSPVRNTRMHRGWHMVVGSMMLAGARRLKLRNRMLAACTYQGCWHAYTTCKPL